MTFNPTVVDQQAKMLVKQGKLAEAKELLRNAIRHNPDDPGILLGLGVVSARTGEHAQAEQCLSRAAEIAPAKPGIHIHLANTLMILHKHDEAISHYREAISLDPGIFAAQYYLASLLLMKKQLEEAKHHFNEALKLNPAHPDCYASLAQIYELQHELDDARKAANRALQLKSDHAGALMLLGKLEKRENNFAEAERIFTIVLESVSDEALIASANIELGLVRDRMGKYDSAWDAVANAKVAWRHIAADFPYDRHAYQKIIQKNISLFNRETFEEWDTPDLPGDERPAPIFFVGFPRSGTTLVEQILGQHPNIVTSNETPLLQLTIQHIPAIMGTDCPHYDCLPDISTQDIMDIRQHYWQLADASINELQDDSLLVDKLPINIVDLGYIARIFPDAHVLVALRDPRDVCLSCYMQAFQLNPAMINFLEMETTVSFYTQVMSLWLHYRSDLPVDWHQYRYEDLVQDEEATAKSIFDFIGVGMPDNYDKSHSPAHHKFIDTPSYQDATTPVYRRSTERWKHYEKQLAPYITKLDPFIKEFGY